MLPTKEEEEAMELERTSNERVENWAQAVSVDGVEHEDMAEPGAEEDRESRFDRPLKEIRVGESPSRPWGISVPIFDPPEGQRPVSPPPAPVSAGREPITTETCPFSHGQQPAVAEKLAVPQNQHKPAGKCPHAGMAVENVVAQEPSPRVRPHTQPTIQTQPAFIQHPEAPKMNSSVPQMIFTGPVFIGYPMEQAMTFMHQYNKGTQ
jgi:hypothetical protein